MQGKKEILLDALLEGSAIILVNQDGMLVALTLDNLFSLVSINGDEITFLMKNITIDNEVGDKEIAWTFNAEDIYMMRTYDSILDNTKSTCFWMDKYPHKEDVKEAVGKKSFIQDIFGDSLKDYVSGDMKKNLSDTILAFSNSCEEDVFEVLGAEDSDLIFALEEYLLNGKGYLALCDYYIPLARD